MLQKTSNPAFSGNVFASQTAFAQNTMTIKGTANKTMTLLGIMLVAALITWKLVFAGNATYPIFMGLGLIAGVVSSIVIIFKPTAAKALSIVYAIGEGFAIGGVSAFYEIAATTGEDASALGGTGIVFNAVLLTAGLFFTMLYLYKERIIEPTRKFTLCIVGAMGAIALVYLIDLVMMLFGSGIGFLHESSPLGIGVSLVIVGVAALSFILDFKNVEDGVRSGAPEYMEWYCAFGIMLTLVWLYLEILRLLAKLNSRD